MKGFFIFGIKTPIRQKIGLLQKDLQRGLLFHAYEKHPNKVFHFNFCFHYAVVICKN